MAERVAGTGGRLIWTAEVPTRMLDRAIQEVEFASDHGAAGVHLHGVENGCYLDDPYFTPLLKRIEDLDLTVVVHIGRPTSQSAGVFPIGRQFPTFASFFEHVGSPLTAFWTLLVSDLHERFPSLRFSFNEVGATWALSLVHHWQRIVASTRDFQIRPVDPAVFEERNIFVSCFADENLPPLLSLLGDNVLTHGTDYGHNDGASQLIGHSSIMGRDDITEALAHRIVDTNGRRAFALDPTFRPTEGLPRRGAMPHTRSVKPEEGGPQNVVGIGT